MRALLIHLLLLICSLPLGAQEPVAVAQDSEPAITTIRFDSSVFDLGEFYEGHSGEFLIWFTNVGANDAIIRVRNTGGNVLASAMAEEVKPGQRGFVRVDFLTLGRVGQNDKSFFVHYNSGDDKPIVIRVKFKVLPDPFRLEPAADPSMMPRHTSVSPLPKITFDSTTCHFGPVREGERARGSFHFRNTGTTPLLLENVKPAHGGVVATYPKDTIPPGGGGVIKFEFNTQGNLGQKNTSITVISTGEPHATVLYLKGTVLPKE